MATIVTMVGLRADRVGATPPHARCAIATGLRLRGATRVRMRRTLRVATRAQAAAAGAEEVVALQSWASGGDFAPPTWDPSVITDLVDSAEESEEAKANLSFFSTSAGAWFYERGYRQIFQFLGYPGVDEEYQTAKALLRRDATTAAALQSGEGRLLDLSCGPGMFAQRFYEDADFATVLASDYSQAMLEQVAGRIAPERGQPAGAARLALMRADVCNLPFADAALVAVHAAAGMHCWPDVRRGLAEVQRVLAPGGVFVASTVSLPQKAKAKFEDKGMSDGGAYLGRVRRQNMPFWDAAQVAGLLDEAGFRDVELVSSAKAFVLVRGTK